MFTQGCMKNASVLFVGTCFLYQLCNQEYVNMIRCFSKKLYIYNTILHCVTKTYATGYFNMHNTKEYRQGRCPFKKEKRYET